MEDEIGFLIHLEVTLQTLEKSKEDFLLGGGRQTATEEVAHSANSCVLGSWDLVPIDGFFYPINVSDLLSQLLSLIA